MSEYEGAGHIAFFLPNLAGGGAERVAVNLLKGMIKRGMGQCGRDFRYSPCPRWWET